MSLKIGKIAYANLFPIFYSLEHGIDCSGYEFVPGVPSALNRMIREGEIDISPSSSIEYLRGADRYFFLDGHSISSKGPIRSIFLFSRKPIEDLDGHTVVVSSQSETSVALLQIVLRKFYGLDSCRFLPAAEPIAAVMQSNEAYLLIGDDALAEERRWPGLLIYDLGDLWYRHTGLPFTFALWIVRRGCCAGQPELLEKFKRDLDAAKAAALRSFEKIAAVSPLRGLLSGEDLVTYWQGISYDFDEEQKRGFDLFRLYAGELGLI